MTDRETERARVAQILWDNGVANGDFVAGEVLAAIDRPAPAEYREVVRREVAKAATAGFAAIENQCGGSARVAVDQSTDAILAAANRPAPVVGVKALEWEGIAGSDWGAETVFRSPYQICFDDADQSYTAVMYNAGRAFRLGAHPSFEKAKAACQADYERRILSAITATSAEQVCANERERLAELGDELNVHQSGSGRFVARLDHWISAQGGE